MRQTPYGENYDPAAPANRPPDPLEAAGQQPRMVPIRMPTGKPYVTYTILALTLLMYALQELNRIGIAREPFLALANLMFGAQGTRDLLAGGWGTDLPILVGGKINELIIEGQLWRLLTPALLHASLIHVGANMYALFIIGPRLERFYGHSRFLGLYLLGALGGNVLSFLLTPNLSIGASTAIFGLFAAEGVLAFQNREVFGQQARAMVTNILYLLAINLFIGLSVPAVDNWGHLGGLVAGLLFAWFAGPRLEVTYNYPEYELVDQRSPAMAALIGVVLFLLIAGVVALRILR
jgi:rhomboid protease GluP